MSMDTHAMDVPMTADDAFAITLLVTCEITKNVLLQRAGGNKKRLYYLDRLCKDIEGLNMTYEGYLPEKFQRSAKKYHQMVEIDINNLLKSYKGEDND